MGDTAQEMALAEGMRQYGSKFFTEDHINYRLVGVRGPKWPTIAIGETWEQALEKLARKVAA